MNLLPKEFVPLILTFVSAVFQACVGISSAVSRCDFSTWEAYSQRLLSGLHHEHNFQNYHRVLNRAVWSSRHASKLLLQQIVSVCTKGECLDALNRNSPLIIAPHHIVEAGIRRKKS